MCCAILHNILIKSNIPFDEDDINIDQPDVELLPPIDREHPLNARQLRQSAIVMRRDEAEDLMRRLLMEEN